MENEAEEGRFVEVRAHYQPCAVNNEAATTEEGEAADEGMGKEREQAGACGEKARGRCEIGGGGTGWWFGNPLGCFAGRRERRRISGRASIFGSAVGRFSPAPATV